MENNIHNTYLFRAIEAYPYELERAIEALNYALSYEPDNVKALCLMARVHNEQLGDKETAKEFYQKAIASNIDNPDIYPDYIRLLVNNGDYAEAETLIEFAMRFEGTAKANIKLVQASLFEATQEFDKAEEALQEAKMIALNNDFLSYVDDVISRVVKKRKVLNNKKREIEKEKPETIKKPETSWFKNRLNNLL